MMIIEKFWKHLEHLNIGKQGEFHIIFRFPNGHGVSIVEEADFISNPPIFHEGFFSIAEMGFDEMGQWLRKDVDMRLVTHNGLDEKGILTVIQKIMKRGKVIRETWEYPKSW